MLARVTTFAIAGIESKRVTVEVDVVLDDGSFGRAMVPSGANAMSSAMPSGEGTATFAVPLARSTS